MTQQCSLPCPGEARLPSTLPREGLRQLKLQSPGQRAGTDSPRSWHVQVHAVQMSEGQDYPTYTHGAFSRWLGQAEADKTKSPISQPVWEERPALLKYKASASLLKD